jgi:hypothetical protein
MSKKNKSKKDANKGETVTEATETTEITETTESTESTESTEASGETTGDTTATPETSPAKAPRAPRAPLGTVAERLLDKGETAVKLIEGALQLATRRGVPNLLQNITIELLTQVKHWKEDLEALKASGWQPTETTAKVDIEEGDPVAIDPAYLDTYSYIPGAREGTADLIAGTCLIVGKSVRILVKPRDGVAYGYIPKNHLVSRK